jgi:hypothetical protein
MLSAHNAFQINITGIRAFRGYPLSPDSQSYPRNIDLQRLLERGHLPIAGRVPPMGTRCVREGISNAGRAKSHNTQHAANVAYLNPEPWYPSLPATGRLRSRNTCFGCATTRSLRQVRSISMQHQSNSFSMRCWRSNRAKTSSSA